MNAVSSEADETYIKKILKDNLKFTMILEFFMSTFTFNIWIELAIIPVITIITVMNVIAVNYWIVYWQSLDFGFFMRQ